MNARSWRWLGLLAVLVGCEEKPELPPRPTAVAPLPPPPAPVPPPLPASAPQLAQTGGPACGWGEIHEGQRVRYRLTEGDISSGPVHRVNGAIVAGDAAARGEGATFELQVLARAGDQAWAKVSFTGVPQLPPGLPPQFLLELHTGPSASADAPAWSLPAAGVTDAQLTVEGKVYPCKDHVTMEPTALHTCVQTPPGCLFWLDGLVRQTRAVGTHQRQELALDAFSPAAATDASPAPREPGSPPFAGAWETRTGPMTAQLFRFDVEGGQLVREARPYQMVSSQEPSKMSGLVRIEGGGYGPAGPATREATSFRGWVLDILGGKPVEPKWIPATTAPRVEYASFP